MKTISKKRIILTLISIVCTVLIVLTGKFFTGQNSAKYQDKDFVAVLNVDQGDSILICSGGQAALIDTGKDMYSREMVKSIRNYGVSRLDALIISHSHDDHTGGAEYLFSKMDIDNVIIPEFRSDENVDGFNSAMSESGADIFVATEGMIINIGNFELTVLYAENQDEDINNRSVVVMAEIDGKKFLFTGDAEKQTEKALIDSGIDFDCDVLKVGHHGSRTSSTKEFIDIATPEYAAISVGENNSYGLPDEDVTSRLETAGAKVYRTDYVGDIVFFIDNGEIVRSQQ